MPDQNHKTMSFTDPFEGTCADGADGAPDGATAAPDAFEGTPNAHPAPPGAAALLGGLGEAEPALRTESNPSPSGGPLKGIFTGEVHEGVKSNPKVPHKAPYGRELWDKKHTRPDGGEEAWIPPEHLDELISRGLEMCLEVPRVVGGETQMHELWIVPKVNEGAERMEITFRDLATIANCLIAFPGAKVTELKPRKD